jgi:hypothetical protein
MKKTLAILLALALVFSTVTVAFAEETLPADAAAVKSLGMLVGGGSGVTVDYLKTAPTRIQAAIMVLRLKGLESAAKAFTGTDNFADANQSAWAAPIMAYLKANPQLGWIGNAGNFDPNGLMDVKAYYKVMLETLGYKQNTSEVIGDFTYAGVLEFAASKGLTKVATVTNFTVNDLAIATIETLKATVKGSTKTLAASLVDAKVITEAAAMAAGLYTVAPVAIGVESVTATNLKEVVVVFNKAVDKDSATEESNYTVEDSDDVEIPVDSVELQADGKTVLLTLTGEFTNGEEFDVTVEDVEDTTGKVIADDTVITAVANDVAAPVALGVKLVGPRTFEITFNEPIDKDVDGTVEVGDDEYPVSLNTATDERVVVVEMSDSELAAKDYKVDISDYKDIAGHKMVAKQFTLAYVKDTTAPTAKIVSADQTEVVIEFSEKVFAGDPDENASLDSNYFYHSLSGYHPDGAIPVDPSSNGKEYTLTWAKGNNPLPEGNVRVVVVYDYDDEIVTDAWGNELASNITLTAAVTADTTKPTVTKVETDGEDTLVVYFSEDVEILDAEELDNYTVLNSDSEEMDITNIDYTSDDEEDEYTATLTITDLDPGKYTVKIADVLDKALDANKMVAATISFDVEDEVAPTDAPIAIGVDGANSDSIYLDFGDDMASTGAYSALDKDNYQVNGDDLETGDAIAFFNGDKSIVKITIADEDLYNFEDDGDEILVEFSRLADVAGNKMGTAGGFAIAAAEGTNLLTHVVTAPAITAFRITDAKTVEIRVNANIKTTTPASGFVVDYVADDLSSVESGLSSIKSITWLPDDGYTKIIGVLKGGQQVNQDTEDNYETLILASDYSVHVTGDVKTVYGTKVNPGLFWNATDKFAPELETIENTADNEITLTFTEDISAAAGAELIATDLIIKDKDGDRLTPKTHYTITSISGDQVVVQFTSTYLDDQGDVAGYIYIGKMTVSTSTTINYLKDTKSNKVKAFAESVTLKNL